jgi:hypothetical protein
VQPEQVLFQQREPVLLRVPQVPLQQREPVLPQVLQEPLQQREPVLLQVPQEPLQQAQALRCLLQEYRNSRRKLHYLQAWNHNYYRT